MRNSYLSLSPPSTVSSQSAFDIFRDRWAYKIPIDGCTTGERLTFFREPPGISLLKNHFPNCKDFLVLELGPHEAEQTYYLDRMTKAVYAIEGRPANFLKCLIVMNELGLNNTHFAVGDFHIYLRAGRMLWDLCYCVGVLYHSPDPVALLHLISKRCKRMILGTVIYDKSGLASADERTKDQKFPTNWLKNIDPEPVRCATNGNSYGYWKRHFSANEEQVTIGQGASHSLTANLLSENDLRRAIIDVGGNILTFERRDDERSPHVLAVVTFQH